MGASLYVVAVSSLVVLSFLFQEREDKRGGMETTKRGTGQDNCYIPFILLTFLLLNSLCSNPNPRYLCSCSALPLHNSRRLIAFDSIKDGHGPAEQQEVLCSSNSSQSRYNIASKRRNFREIDWTTNFSFFYFSVLCIQDYFNYTTTKLYFCILLSENCN